MKILQSFLSIFVAIVAILSFVPPALAFCGFYIAKAATAFRTGSSDASEIDKMGY